MEQVWSVYDVEQRIWIIRIGTCLDWHMRIQWDFFTSTPQGFPCSSLHILALSLHCVLTVITCLHSPWRNTHRRWWQDQDDQPLCVFSKWRSWNHPKLCSGSIRPGKNARVLDLCLQPLFLFFSLLYPMYGFDLIFPGVMVPLLKCFWLSCLSMSTLIFLLL